MAVSDEIWGTGAGTDIVSEVTAVGQVSEFPLYEGKTPVESDKDKRNKVESVNEKPYTNEKDISQNTVNSKEHYESLTDKEKLEWLGISDCDLQTAIHIYLEKMAAIGYADKRSEEILDEFMQLEAVINKEEKYQEKESRFRVI